MPDLPPQAVTAAAIAIATVDSGVPEDFARAALEAAGPYLAAAEREACAQLIEARASRCAGTLTGHALYEAADLLRKDPR